MIYLTAKKKGIAKREREGEKEGNCYDEEFYNVNVERFGFALLPLP